ncbi:alpha/beta hydrolase [uncultured Ruegeria sp.]|uniref:alpha/beta hydrolase fold domain-containing protein n=1 Tax=uncultured Ruegeria sp. TaxID=259304 RepID=UPI00263889EE|nr:alpha/beta hydrolase [uncultured Ruegeria sp.]
MRRVGHTAVSLVMALGAATSVAALDVTPPTTISAQAAAELQALDPSRDPTLGGLSYADAFQALSEGTAEAVAAALQQFPATVETSTIDGADHLLITPANLNPALKDHLLIHVHGGAHVFFSPESAQTSSLAAAQAVGVRILSVRYPLAWQAPFPASRDRVMAVYRELLTEYPSDQLAFYGDSAGGGLILSTLQQLQAEGLDMPAAAALLSPWTDVSGAGDSYTVMSGQDPIIDYPISLAAAAREYVGDLTLNDPGPSPIYGPIKPGLPPILLTTGTRDLFLSDAARLQRRLLDAQVPVDLIVYEGMWHVFQTSTALPESGVAWADMAGFLRKAWAR